VVGIREAKIPLARHRRWWEYNIRLHHREIVSVSGYGSVANSFKHSKEPSGFMKDGKFLD